jgi:ferrous iron transport protein A
LRSARNARKSADEERLLADDQMTLADANDGQWLVVSGTSDDDVMWQALRFGIGVGSVIQVQQNIPHGPVIVSKKHVEIAIGRQLAKSVNVKPADNVSPSR